jgi:Terminase small subunit
MSGATLTPKRQRFIEEYLIDRDATKAAIRAGYSSRTASQIGYQLLQKTSVREAVEAGTAKATNRTESTVDWIATELQETYRRATSVEQYGAANKSLELLGRYRGMFPKEVHHRGWIGVDVEPAGGETARKVIEDDRGASIIDRLFDAVADGGAQPVAPGDGSDPGEVRPGSPPAAAQSPPD